MDISVVIRTRDKEKYLDTLLKSLVQQTVQTSEIVIVDNYSSEERKVALEENLRENAEKFFKNTMTRLKLATLCDSEFSHAYSTNLGVSAAENEFICITNGHSVPISRNWLYDGSKHFKEGSVAGVSGFFIPHKDATFAGRFDKLLYYYGQRAVPHKDWFCTMTSIIRKEFWRTYPFDENLLNLVPETRRYGLEDYDWGREMTARGHKILVDPMFSVFHSHTRGIEEIARNVKNYFVYRQIQQKIKSFCRPRRSFTRVPKMGCANKIWP